MKVVEVVDYLVHFYDHSPIEISQLQGEKLMLALAQSNCPRFLHIDGHMISKSAIKMIAPVQRWTTEQDDRGLDKRVPQKIKLEGRALQVHRAYLDFANRGENLLDDGKG